MKKGDKTMKKVLLSSVAALAVFAAAAPVFAEDLPFGGPNGDQVNIRGWVDNNKDNEGDLNQARLFGNVSEQENSKAKTGEANNAVVEPKKDANGNVIENEFVLRDKGPKADKAEEKKDAKKEEGKAPAAAGQKTLPKTSAVK